MKTYCPDCGTKIEYAAKKPNFCLNCGYAFAGASKTVKNIPTPDHTEEMEESEFNSNVNHLDFELEMSPQKGVRLGDIVGTANEGEEGFERDPDPEVSRDEFLSNFKKEAGSSRGNKNEDTEE